jgi:hypothetical protein
MVLLRIVNANQRRNDVEVPRLPRQAPAGSVASLLDFDPPPAILNHLVIRAGTRACDRIGADRARRPSPGEALG